MVEIGTSCIDTIVVYQAHIQILHNVKEPVLFRTACQSTVYSWSLKTELYQTLYEAIL